MRKDLKRGTPGSPYRLARMLGMLTKDNQIQENIPKGNRSSFAQTKYKFFLEAPFEISNQCCNVMKKSPAHKYSKETGRLPMTAQMASESRVRLQQWIRNGCNGFDMKSPVSNPLSFWTENDILEYIYWYGLDICPVYGKVIVNRDKMQNTDGYTDEQLAERPDCIYKTTGCDRTGCMLCGFGCHLEKSPNRFEMLKETHPGMYGMLDRVQNNGVTMREAIDWINENSDVSIKY